jgi:uncharacterized SAM-binding protein YcdF (DUF218 family)
LRWCWASAAFWRDCCCQWSSGCCGHWRTGFLGRRRRPHVDGIIALGGAIDGLLSDDRRVPALNAQAEWLTELLILARRYLQARLAFTGGDGSPLPGAISEAEPARQLLTYLGLQPERVAFEGASRTTWENVTLARDLLHPAAGEAWLVIT